MLEYFLTAIAVLVLLVVMMSVKIVRQGYRYTIERFGRFVRVAEPGFNLLMQFNIRFAVNGIYESSLRTVHEPFQLRRNLHRQLRPLICTGRIRELPAIADLERFIEGL